MSRQSECFCRVGADFAGFEPQLDGDFVRLSADTFFPAAQNLEYEIGREFVRDRPLGDRDTFRLKLRAGFSGGTQFH
ncbi:hypothetical protein WK41_14655 [Burkholderia cepacia]|nr:hypothetical protein WK41_14655 [Burkholderia cepacia]